MSALATAQAVVGRFNSLILGPDGYRFGDYWRMGLPLGILILLVAIPTILVVRPL